LVSAEKSLKANMQDKIRDILGTFDESAPASAPLL
jgi:hypothetical protein